MSLRSIFAMGVIAAVCFCEQGMAQRLEGCSDPSAIAAGLKALRTSDWKGVSLARLQKLWPTNLRSLDYHEGSWMSVGHEGRIIGGEVECADVFNFDIGSKKEDGTEKEQLRGFTIHYTAQTQEETVAIARTFASATGLSAVNIATLGQEKSQQFSWETNAFGREMSVLALRWSRVGSHWSLYFSLDRNPLGLGGGSLEEKKKP